ncbi:MAG TPA: F390 synthetase-related protein [Allosphingosinicella sp.]
MAATPSPSNLLAAARAFARTRWLQWRLRSPADVERLHERRLARMMRETILPSPFYRDLGVTRFADLPVMDKETLLANFERLNRRGLSAAQVRDAIARGEDRIGDFVIGQSTGTSGNRGYYVISDAERFVWLGTILAKTLPDALWRRHRVALAMPGLSSLYRSASTGSRIALGFFDLAEGVDAWADRLGEFAPDTIVAPPKVLRRLAERGRLPATHIFSGAEVLDPLDRAAIEAATGKRVREIYMATEGLFGVGCPHGTLHLAEDAVHFEWEPIGGGPLASPLVTDFTRRAQVMARYRMNDLLELSDTPCPCGSPLQPVERIEGRQDDVFELAGRMVTPDVLRNAVVDADRTIADFRIVQTGPAAVEIALDPGLEAAVDERVRASVGALFERLGLGGIAIAVERGLDTPFDRKLRQVRRDWRL